MGVLQERITSTKTGSITSIQACRSGGRFDPTLAGDDLCALGRTVVLSRQIASLGIYPAVDPLDSTSRQLTLSCGEDHTIRRAACRPYCSATRAQEHHRDSRHDELSEEDKLTVYRARKNFSGSCRNPSTWPRYSPGKTARSCPSRHHPRLQGHHRGEYDHLPEQAFYMIGAIKEAVEKSQDPGLKRSCQHHSRRHRQRRGQIFSGEASMVFVPGSQGELASRRVIAIADHAQGRRSPRESEGAEEQSFYSAAARSKFTAPGDCAGGHGGAGARSGRAVRWPRSSARRCVGERTDKVDIAEAQAEICAPWHSSGPIELLRKKR